MINSASRAHAGGLSSGAGSARDLHLLEFVTLAADF